ncbi:Ubiquitin domain-containing protein UBFD1, partial [Gryllus bimaculatus]
MLSFVRSWERGSDHGDAHEEPDKSGDLSAKCDIDASKEVIDFKVVYNKNKYDVSFAVDKTIGELKVHLEDIIGVPHAMQKVMIKGLAKDERTLRDLGVVKGAKVMVVGSKLDDVLAVSTPSKQDFLDEKASSTTKEPFCKQKQHKKVIDIGIPEDVMPGIKNAKVSSLVLFVPNV